jgi:hypothetical protein
LAQSGKIETVRSIGRLPPATHNTGSRANFRFDVRAPSCPNSAVNKYDRLLPQPLAQDPTSVAAALMFLELREGR